eukprot:g24021.t1
MKQSKMVNNALQARFEQDTSGAVSPAPTALDAPVPTITTAEVRLVFLGILPRKATEVLKKKTIIPVSKKAHATCLNDGCPVAMTSIIMKCFERLVMAHINLSLSACLDPLQFAYRHHSKTKELIIDFRKKRGEHTPIYIDGAEFERVGSVELLGVMRTDNLSWISHIDATVKAQQCLFFLRRLRKFGMSVRTLTNFYRCTIESIL